MRLLSKPAPEEIIFFVLAIVALFLSGAFSSGGTDLAGGSGPIDEGTATPISGATSPGKSGLVSNPPPPVGPESKNPDECDFRKEMKRVLSAVVSVVASDGSSGQRGTGFHLGDGRYVTAAHVVQDDAGNLFPSISISSASMESTFEATVVAAGSMLHLDHEAWGRDIAELRSVAVNDSLNWRAPTDDDAAREVRAIGYPMSQIHSDTAPLADPYILKGTLSGGPVTSGVELVQSDVQAEEGMSGGPLVDECGTVIAITAGAHRLDVVDGRFKEGLGIFISIIELDNIPSLSN